MQCVLALHVINCPREATSPARSPKRSASGAANSVLVPLQREPVQQPVQDQQGAMRSAARRARAGRVGKDGQRRPGRLGFRQSGCVQKRTSKDLVLGSEAQPGARSRSGTLQRRQQKFRPQRQRLGGCGCSRAARQGLPSHWLSPPLCPRGHVFALALWPGAAGPFGFFWRPWYGARAATMRWEVAVALFMRARRWGQWNNCKVILLRSAGIAST